MPDPQCIKEGSDVSCPVKFVELCNDDVCECLEGMQRSKVTRQCEWKLDVVCQKVSSGYTDWYLK